MAFNLYLDDAGKPVFNDKGIPLYMQDGGSEPTPIDIDGLYDLVRKNGTEAAAHRKEKEEIQGKLKAYEGLDPAKAREALSLVAKLDASQLLDAGKVDELKQKITLEAQHKIENLNKALEEANAKAEKVAQDKEQVIHNLLVKNAFSSSGFLKEKTVLPADFAYNNFRHHFAVEYSENGDPVVIARDAQGNPIFSDVNAGAYANPDESIKRLIEQHPQRDSLLKNSAPNGGSGSSAGNYSHGAGQKTLTRAEFDKLEPSVKAEKVNSGYIVVD